MPPLEVPVFSPPSASLAIAAGAHRIELNRAGSYPQGGLTPSLADLEALLSGSSPVVPLRVMIRPRGPPPAGEEGAPDFVYSDDDFGEMRAAVCAFRDSGLLRRERGDGFVFGVLRAAGAAAVVVDVERNRELVGLAGGLPCVFHRAFDDILGTDGSPVEAALADLDRCNFHGLLTSGGPGAAADHIDSISRILKSAPKSLNEVIVGGGVRSSNVQKLRESLPVSEGVEVWFHSSCLTNAREGDVVDQDELQAIVQGLV